MIKSHADDGSYAKSERDSFAGATELIFQSYGFVFKHIMRCFFFVRHLYKV